MYIDDIDEFVSDEELKKRKGHRDYILQKGKRRKTRNTAYEREYSELVGIWECENAANEQHKKLKSNFKKGKKKAEFWRGKVTKTKLKRILMAEAERRAEIYEREQLGLTGKCKILCIVGEAGSGTTLASLHLRYKLGANVVCSFTTRPPRSTEVEGRDHHFIDIVPPADQVIAFTVRSGNIYYGLKTQIFGCLTVYVVDEDGLADLIENHSDEYDIYSVYIKRNRSLRKRAVGNERLAMDNSRTPFDLSFYNYVVYNNSTKAELFKSVEKIYNELKGDRYVTEGKE